MWQFWLCAAAFVAAVALIMRLLRTPPLHQAIKDGDFDRVKALVEGGADLNRLAYAPGSNSDGATPLHLAAYRGYLEIAEHLIEKGAKVDAASPRMLETPLHDAACNERREGTTMAGLLIRNGAKVGAKNIDGYTPLHLAAEKGRRETVELLLSAGADIRGATSIGLTALHCAARGDKKETAQVLVSKGASLDALDAKGRTPLALARASGSDETAAYLESAAPERKRHD